MTFDLEGQTEWLRQEREVLADAHRYPVTTALQWRARANLLGFRLAVARQALEQIANTVSLDAPRIARQALDALDREPPDLDGEG